MNKCKILISLILSIFITLNLIALKEKKGEKKEIKELREKILAMKKNPLEKLKIKQEIRNKIESLTENDMIQLGFSLFRKGKSEKALHIIKISTELYPNSWKTWNALGDSYWTVEQLNKALASYQKALDFCNRNKEISNNIRLLNTEIYGRSNETRIKLRYPDGQLTNRQGLYFGEKVGAYPKVFAPGIVSSFNNMEFGCTFSKDGKEFYFSRRKNGDGNWLMVSKLTDKGWTAPKISSIAKKFYNNEPHITYDGKTMFFGSLRSADPKKRPRSFYTWMVQRVNGKWGDASYFGPGMFVSTSKYGHLYTTDISNFAGGGIVLYSFDKKKGYGKPIKIFKDKPKGFDRRAHPCIDWEERFLIFNTERKDGIGGSDLYIVFKQKDGSWGKEIHMGDKINSRGHDFGASLSPDGKYMFYSRNRDIYWVNIKNIIKNIKN